MRPRRPSTPSTTWASCAVPRIGRRWTMALATRRARGLLAKLVDDPNEVPLRKVVDHVIGGELLIGPETHVEGAVAEKAESPLAVLHLQAGESQVQEHPRHRAAPEELALLCKRCIRRVYQTDSLSEACQPLTCGRQGDRIAVQPDDNAVRCGVEDGFSVSTLAHRAIDIRAS